MAITKAAQWYCANDGCGFSAILTWPEKARKFPVCVCGTVMRRSAPRPESTYLDFLHSEGGLGQLAGSRKEA
jgi:hypothetical protein